MWTDRDANRSRRNQRPLVNTRAACGRVAHSHADSPTRRPAGPRPLARQLSAAHAPRRPLAGSAGARRRAPRGLGRPGCAAGTRAAAGAVAACQSARRIRAGTVAGADTAARPGAADCGLAGSASGRHPPSAAMACRRIHNAARRRATLASGQPGRRNAAPSLGPVFASAARRLDGGHTPAGRDHPRPLHHRAREVLHGRA